MFSSSKGDDSSSVSPSEEKSPMIPSSSIESIPSGRLFSSLLFSFPGELSEKPGSNSFLSDMGSSLLLACKSCS